MELWHYDLIKSFISNFVMIFSLSRHGRKHWLTRLQCDGDKSLLIISYANFITVFWQFSDDTKYLSSYHKEMITARICSLWGDAYVVQIAIVATGFYMWYCHWQVTIYTLRFSVFTSVQSKFSSFFSGCFYFGKRRHLQNIHFSSSLERPMETSRRNTASRHRDNVHVYDKWPVWG